MAISDITVPWNGQTYSNVESFIKGVLASLDDVLSGKQATLVSGVSIKTVNNQSLVGSGNISIEGGSQITVDQALSSTSTNPVQNKAVYAALATKQATLTFDSTPTANSNNPVRSSGIYAALQNKVNTDGSKGLSSNDFTDALKAKLNSIADNAQENVIERITFNGTTLTVANKGVSMTSPVTSVNGRTGAVTITVPTKTSDLTNDSNYITSATLNSTLSNYVTSSQMSSYATSSQVQTMISTATDNAVFLGPVIEQNVTMGGLS